MRPWYREAVSHIHQSFQKPFANYLTTVGYTCHPFCNAITGLPNKKKCEAAQQRGWAEPVLQPFQEKGSFNTLLSLIPNNLSSPSCLFLALCNLHKQHMSFIKPTSNIGYAWHINVNMMLLTMNMQWCLKSLSAPYTQSWDRDLHNVSGRITAAEQNKCTYKNVCALSASANPEHPKGQSHRHKGMLLSRQMFFELLSRQDH